MSEKTESVQYDPLNPYPWYHFMRANHPVYYDEQFNTWYIFRYQDAQRTLSDSKTFTSKGATAVGLMGESFIGMDPPEHHKYRTLVSQAFTPRRISQLEPRIAAIVHQMLDAVMSAGQIDVIADLSYPLAAVVIAELLGVPKEDRDRFKFWSDAIVTEYQSHIQDQSISPQDEMAAYLLPLIEQRRLEPQDDLISALLQAEVGGEQLTTREILSTVTLLLVAGHQTTMYLVGNAMYAFTEFPEALEELQADPSLIPNAIEEVLRFYPPTSGTLRVAAVDTSLEGIDIPAGSLIIANVASANRDESVFPNPDHFDIRRNPNRHITFGHSVHFCLGAPLARLETRIAVTLLLERCLELQRIPDRPAQMRITHRRLFQNTGKMPLTFLKRTLE